MTTSHEVLTAARDLIQEDLGDRGLAHEPNNNLITTCADDFARACQSLAETPHPVIGIVTGFIIPTADPPRAETDGPLGAIYLARAFHFLGFQIVLMAEDFVVPSLVAGLRWAGMKSEIPIRELTASLDETWTQSLTHLIAIERPGPSHTIESLTDNPLSSPESLELFESEIPPEQWDRYHTMRGRDISDMMMPAHRLFEAPLRPPVTIGIGDGGNEIGMGKIPWEVIRANVDWGGLIAARVPTDYLIVAGVSNWGGYALAAGTALARGQPLNETFFDLSKEQALLEIMVNEGSLVDGLTAQPTATVDGLSFDRYARKLRQLGELFRKAT